jgi:hypothetical protein
MGDLGEADVICSLNFATEILRSVLERSQGIPPKSPTGLAWGEERSLFLF